MKKPNSDTPETDALREAFHNDDSTAQNAHALEHYCTMEELAEKLERERDEARQALKRQSQNYISLYEAVLGDGCTTSDVKDVNEIARQHRTERDQLRNEISTLETRHAAVMLLTQSVVDENTQLRKVADELYKNLSYVSSEQPENDILCADGFTMSFHKGSPLHEEMKAALSTYNNLTHVKDKTK